MTKERQQILEALAHYDHSNLWSEEELREKKKHVSLAWRWVMSSGFWLSTGMAGFAAFNQNYSVSLLLMVLNLTMLWYSIEYIYPPLLNANKKRILEEEHKISQLVNFMYQPPELLNLFKYLRGLEDLALSNISMDKITLQRDIEQAFAFENLTATQKDREQRTKAMLRLLRIVSNIESSHKNDNEQVKARLDAFMASEEAHVEPSNMPVSSDQGVPLGINLPQALATYTYSK